jgi:uncharacterized protein
MNGSTFVWIEGLSSHENLLEVSQFWPNFPNLQAKAMEWYYYIIAPVLGILIGFINTLAGSGTLLTLPFLIFLGLPPNVANGTNRLGILAQSFVGTMLLRRQSKISLQGTWILIVPSVIGSAIGAYTASVVDPDALKGLIGVMMVLMIFPILGNTEKWKGKGPTVETFERKPLLFVLMLLLGFYGGFIQGGAGLFIFVILVLVAHHSMEFSNVVKNLIVLLFTVPALAIFIYQDQVNWEIGSVMMIGQSLGAWLAVRFVGKNPRANEITRWLLVVMLVGSAAKMFWDFL